MPFGLTNSPIIFERLMNKCLYGYSMYFCSRFFGDVLFKKKLLMLIPDLVSFGIML